MSRASTTSAASPAPEAVPNDMQYAQQQYVTSGPEAALLQYAGTQNGLSLDPILQQGMHNQQMHAGYDQFPQQQSYTSQDTSYMMQNPEYSTSVQIPVGAPAAGLEPEDRRRKNSATTATNDKELRELLARNETRALKDVAQEVIQKERTPQAEKTKQLFAMLWYVCTAAAWSACTHS